MKKVTLGWDGNPTIVVDGQYVYPRKAELIFHRKYYPNWPYDKWPIDPETGKKLEMEDMKPESKEDRKIERPDPPKPRRRRNGKYLEDYDECPPPPSEDVLLFNQAWRKTKYVKLNIEKD